jgi:very-short-patch-repair endonuclease
MNGTELRVWIRLRGRQLDGWKFRRQQPIGPYYVDFYCPAAKLVIEIDGLSHQEELAAYDIRRQAWLEAEGHRVVRFPVRDIDENVVDVMDTIRVELEEREQLGFRRRLQVESSPSGASRHLPINGEDCLTPPP